VNPAAATTIAGPSSALQLALVLGLASLLPAIILTCTCFARFLVVFSFLKTGLGTPGAPPNQVLVGLALFMTLFVMGPVAAAVHERALSPYFAGQLDERGALEAGTPPLRDFLLRRTREKDLALFYDLSRAPRPSSPDEVPLRIAVPAFTLSELRTSFEMGLVVLLPFLVIDLVVATVLSSLGMVMLPPAVVALPVKLLVFVAVDGWHLIVRSLLRGVV
jgi:flagellar biosynthetic protein FliP